MSKKSGKGSKGKAVSGSSTAAAKGLGARKAGPAARVAGAGRRAANAAPVRATSGDGAVPVRDQRLPPPGTTLVKRDRNGQVRCECNVEDGGSRYRGTLHRSLSGAASAAAEHLGIKGRVNGFIFWGLVKAARPNAGEHLRKLAQRYEEQVATLLKQGAEEVRGEVRRDLEAHASRLSELLSSAAA
jgi:hypothetical protein